MTSSNRNHLPEAPPPYTITLGLGLRRIDLGETQFGLGQLGACAWSGIHARSPSAPAPIRRDAFLPPLYLLVSI